MNQTLKNNLLFASVFTAMLTPMIFFVMGLPMILQMKGFDASFIGMFQLAGLPMVLKFLFSAPIDKIVFKKHHYKKWTFYSGVFYVGLLVAISFLSLEENFYLVFISILFTAFISTFMDIPLNALAIKVFKKEERIGAGSFKISAYSLAAMLGGGVFLLFYNHLGWQITFMIMATLVLLSLFALYFIFEIGIWIFILSFYFAFISALWVFMKPYLISKGIKADDVAIYVGIYGSFIAVFGGMLSGVVGKRFSKKVLLLIFMCFNIASALVLILIETYTLNFYFLLVSVTLTALSIALSSAIVFSMIMDYSRSNTRAIDYSIQSSLFAFTRMISAVIAGIFVSLHGFKNMFIFEALAMVVVFFMIYRFYKIK
jgi:PAT family beta-lactamase induction signal transducer AmpG